MFVTNVLADKKNLDTLITQLSTRLTNLKNEHSQFAKINTKESFVFGLDSLYFQFNLLNIEFKNVKEHYVLISNRMYCENYKLYKLMANYIHDNLIDKNIKKVREITYSLSSILKYKSSNNLEDPMEEFSTNVGKIISNSKFEQYKENNTCKGYLFEKILAIYKCNTEIIQCLKNLVKKQQITLARHREKQNVGFNINNFVSSFEYEIDSIQRKIDVFEKYITFLSVTHLENIKYLTKKVECISAQIDKDICFVSSDKKEGKNVEIENSDSDSDEKDSSPLIEND